MSSKLRTSKYCFGLLVTFACISAFISYYYLYNVIRFDFNRSEHPTTIYPYIAFIIDDRATPKLVTVVLNVLQHIPTDWKVQIFTHDKSWSFYKQSALSPFILSNRVFMTSINFPRNNMSGDDFINLYLTSPSLWRHVHGEKALYFQIDSVICSNSSYKLTDFLHYDFIGAPWSVGGCCNGGFSIRSRAKTLQLLESGQVHYPLGRIHEDGWFTNNLPRVQGIVAPISIAKTFSVETIYHPRPFAVHKPLIRFLGKENMIRLCNECPEVRTIANCQLK
jgi:hypothetical protein